MLEDKIIDKKPLYSKNAALIESNRCLYCHDAPCIQACPTSINVPRFINQIANNDVRGAASTILDANILGYSCARVCPVEVLCVGSCVFNHDENPPIQIGRLQRYAVENAQNMFGFENLLPKRKAATGKKIAFIGSGAASLSAAALLALEGHTSVVFEKKKIAGGLNSLGIAPYKLHRSDAILEIKWLCSLGVEIELETEILAADAEKLLHDFDAVFFGIGLGADRRLSIPGAYSQNVWGAVDLIEKIKSDEHFDLSWAKIAHVYGGGNTAIDIAHELKLLGVEQVNMLYYKSADNLSAYIHEVHAAQKNGIRISCNQELSEIIEQPGASKILLINDTQKKCSYKTPSDLIVFAIGQQKLTELASALELQIDESGKVVVDKKTGRTSNAKVWSGGDCVSGGQEVVNAVQDGKIAALSIHKILSEEKVCPV